MMTIKFNVTYKPKTKVKVIHLTPSIVWHSVKLNANTSYQYFHLKFLIFWVSIKFTFNKTK